MATADVEAGTLHMLVDLAFLMACCIVLIRVVGDHRGISARSPSRNHHGRRQHAPVRYMDHKRIKQAMSMHHADTVGARDADFVTAAVCCAGHLAARASVVGCARLLGSAGTRVSFT